MSAPSPIDRAFREEQPEVRVQRMWRGIEAQRAGATRPARWRWPALAATTLIAVGAALLVARTRATGPLMLASGRAIPATMRASGAPRVVTFSDDSRARVGASARLDRIESSDRSVGFALREGSVAFSVVPHGPRRWRVDCGAVQVEVVGTVFSVSRTADAVAVSVQRGAVVVRGEGVPDGVVRLGRGQRIVVATRLPREVAIAPLTPTPTTSVTPAEAPRAPTRAPERARAPSSDDAFRDALARQAYDEAYAAIGSAALTARASRSSDIDELFDLADVARLSGHPAVARAPLARIVALFPSDTRAAMAAFTLGQIELGAMHDPRAAATRFQQSLALGLPRGARETASARLVESLSRSGSPNARSVAQAYLADYPNGRYRDEVSRWGGL